MKILWMVNNLPPNIAEAFGGGRAHAISWVQAMSEQLALYENVELAIITATKCENIEKKIIDGVNYYIFPDNDNIAASLERIVSEFVPDIIHIYGTEQRHGCILAEIALSCPVVVSLQGILSEYIKFYKGGLTAKELRRNTSLRGFLVGNEIKHGEKNYKKNIVTERKLLGKVKYAEGRSLWDKTTVLNINGALHYYHCPRMIRKEFYAHKWELGSCERRSILVHQGNYPIKGLHFMLDALAIIKKTYPDVKLYITGSNFAERSKMQRRLFGGTYANIIRSKIENYELAGNIEFLGFLSPKEMADRLSTVNVCVNCSAIENVPNSVAEAMLVGTPIVASCVGGTAEMLNYGECGYLYSYDDPIMLAGLICYLFEHDGEAVKKSEAAYNVARERHDQKNLSARLISIYKDIIEKYKS